jgi:hypothetical protein
MSYYGHTTVCEFMLTGFVLQLIKMTSNQYRISNTERNGLGGVEPTTSAMPIIIRADGYLSVSILII